MTVYFVCSTMASGDVGGSRPQEDRSGVTIRDELQTSWNAPKSFVDLELPGVVKLNTSVVSDILGHLGFIKLLMDILLIST